MSTPNKPIKTPKKSGKQVVTEVLSSLKGINPMHSWALVHIDFEEKRTEVNSQLYGAGSRKMMVDALRKYADQLEEKEQTEAAIIQQN